MSGESAGIAFGTLYARALQELSSPDLNQIKLLRDLAKENVDKAPHIVAAITGHLFNCPPSMRLAALYLVDCLMKNVPDPYAPIFELSLYTMFKFVWDGASNDSGLRAKLVKLSGTWETQRTLPTPLMSSIQAVISPPAPPGPTSLPTAAPSAAPVTAHSPSPAPQLLWPPPMLGMPFPLPQPVLLPPPLPQQQPQEQQQPNSQPPSMQTFMASAGWGSLPMPVPQVLSQGFPTLMLSGGQLLPMPHLPMAPAPSASQPPPAQQPAPLAGTDLAATLESLGRCFGVHTNVAAGSMAQPLQQAQAALADYMPLPPPPHLPVTQQQQQQQQRIVISQSNIKEFCQPAVDQLLASSDATRSKFLDLQFLRNRRAKSTTHRSRPWFVNVEQWLQGTRADERDAGLSFFEEGEQGPGDGGTAAESVPQLVEEDPSQPTCAISGEAFERMYDPDTDKWYYEDAVVLWDEQATNAGVMEGSIVKVHCLAGAPAPLSSSLGLDSMQQKPEDDVTPALVDAASTAAAELPGAAGACVTGADTHVALAGVNEGREEPFNAPASVGRVAELPDNSLGPSLPSNTGQAAEDLHPWEAPMDLDEQQQQAELPAPKRAKVAE